MQQKMTIEKDDRFLLELQSVRITSYEILEEIKVALTTIP